MEFIEFLKWLVGPGVEVTVGVLLAFLVENWPEYQELDSKTKRLIFLVSCMGIPVAGAAVGAAFKYWGWDFETVFWPAVQAGAVVFLASQATHAKFIKK